MVKGTADIIVYDTRYPGSLTLWRRFTADVEISSTLLGSGGCRNAYLMRFVGDTEWRFVAKCYQRENARSFVDDYRAAHFASSCASALNALGASSHVECVVPDVILYLDATKKRYFVEPYLGSSFAKYNDIFGGVSASATVAPAPDALSHLSLVLSNGQHLILDVQGTGGGGVSTSNPMHSMPSSCGHGPRAVSPVAPKDPVRHVLSDPAVCTVTKSFAGAGTGAEESFGYTDTGRSGLDKWQREHRCTAVCKELGLPDVYDSTGNNVGDACARLRAKLVAIAKASCGTVGPWAPTLPGIVPPAAVVTSAFLPLSIFREHVPRLRPPGGGAAQATAAGGAASVTRASDAPAKLAKSPSTVSRIAATLNGAAGTRSRQGDAATVPSAAWPSSWPSWPGGAGGDGAAVSVMRRSTQQEPPALASAASLGAPRGGHAGGVSLMESVGAWATIASATAQPRTRTSGDAARGATAAGSVPRPRSPPQSPVISPNMDAVEVCREAWARVASAGPAGSDAASRPAAASPGSAAYGTLQGWTVGSAGGGMLRAYDHQTTGTGASHLNGSSPAAAGVGAAPGAATYTHTDAALHGAAQGGAFVRVPTVARRDLRDGGGPTAAVDAGTPVSDEVVYTNVIAVPNATSSDGDAGEGTIFVPPEAPGVPGAYAHHGDDTGYGTPFGDCGATDGTEMMAGGGYSTDPLGAASAYGVAPGWGTSELPDTASASPGGVMAAAAAAAYPTRADGAASVPGGTSYSAAHDMGYMDSRSLIPVVNHASYDTAAYPAWGGAMAAAPVGGGRGHLMSSPMVSAVSSAGLYSIDDSDGAIPASGGGSAPRSALTRAGVPSSGPSPALADGDDDGWGTNRTIVQYHNVAVAAAGDNGQRHYTAEYRAFLGGTAAPYPRRGAAEDQPQPVHCVRGEEPASQSTVTPHDRMPHVAHRRPVKLVPTLPSSQSASPPHVPPPTWSSAQRIPEARRSGSPGRQQVPKAAKASPSAARQPPSIDVDSTRASRSAATAASAAAFASVGPIVATPSPLQLSNASRAASAVTLPSAAPREAASVRPQTHREALGKGSGAAPNASLGPRVVRGAQPPSFGATVPATGAATGGGGGVSWSRNLFAPQASAATATGGSAGAATYTSAQGGALAGASVGAATLTSDTRGATRSAMTRPGALGGATATASGAVRSGLGRGQVPPRRQTSHSLTFV